MVAVRAIRLPGSYVPSRRPGSPARVAELADAEGLNPSGPEGPCGVEPRPGHRLTRATWSVAAASTGWVVLLKALCCWRLRHAGWMDCSVACSASVSP